MRKVAQAYLANEYEAKVEKLTQELKDMCKRQLELEKGLEQTCLLLFKLKEELTHMRAQHEPEFNCEKIQTGLAEERLQQQII